MSSRRLALLAGAVMISGGAFAPAAAAPATMISWSAYDLKLRSGEHRAGEIGQLTVPKLRNRPEAGTLQISFLRLPATGVHKGSPIIYLAGGPGSSGIESAQGDRSVLFDRLRRHGDVILLDQRGVGLSSLPPACSAPWHFPDDVASDEESVNRSLEQALSRCADEWRRAGVLLEAFNTAENAADVADLIRALGTPRARLVGISYGTFLGFAILRDYAGMIESAVFAGTEGPDHTVKLPTQADDVLAGLSRRFKTRSPPFDLEASVRRVFRSLEQSPVNVRRDDRSNQVVSLYDAQMVTAFLMATSENAERLPSLLTAMERCDFSGMAQSVLRLRKFYGTLPAMPLATDGASTVSQARSVLARRLARRSLFGNAVNFPSADLAGALKIAPLPARFHQPLRTNVPALFISGELDSRTPPRNAETVRRGFTTSTHLVVGGGGHDNDLFLATPLILDRIESFLDGVRLRDEQLTADPSRLDGSH